MSESKACTLCGADLPLSAFGADRQKRDGLSSWCRPCKAAKSRTYRGSIGIRRPDAHREVHGKACPRCAVLKPWTDFATCVSARDGRQTYCRPCSTQLQRETSERQKVIRDARYAEKLARFADEKATKKCVECGEVKPHIDFYAHRSTVDGRANRCSACERLRLREQRVGRLEEIRRESARRYADPVFRARARQQQKRSWLLKYGLTPEDYNRILADQGGACAICRTPGRTFEDRNLNVDHDHETGQVRGLLCGFCNWGLGHFKDDVERLRNAVNYLNDCPAQRVLTN